MGRALLGLGLWLAGASGALAQWRYCLGIDRAGHTAYVSDHFRSAEDLDALDEAFAHSLDGLPVPHDLVQCPRARTENDILTLRIVGMRFNREEGRTVVDLRWRPAPPPGASP